MIETTLNGRTFEFEAQHPDETVVELLRGTVGLTGTKLACGGGACGACTVLVDGLPVASCLLPVQHIAGRQVQTVEFHGPDNLHPVQRAFMACDALQCGFCTPGFINSGIAFYERWRDEHGAKPPGREAIAAALSGNLCRCGAYPAIYRAMVRACAGDFDDDQETEHPRYEALEKVTGQAKYTVDQHFDDQLEGLILRSEHPHAKVIAIHASAALALPGVYAFCELLNNDRLVRYAGQPIGAVAAADRRTARSALALVEVDYEVYPAAVGPERARAADAPEVYSGFGPFRSPPSAGEGFSMPGRWQRNVRRPLTALTDKSPGKAERAIKMARRAADPGLLELTTRNSVQVHTALEPHACLAKWQDRDRLAVYLSTQSVHVSAHHIAERFDLDENNVHLSAEHVGGGFGGKQGMSDETIAAVTLARMADRPVRVVYDRLEEMSYAALRPGNEVQLSLLTDEDGTLEAMSATSHGDAGIAVGTGTGQLIGFFSPDVPRQILDRDVVNHSPPGKPFRGPGGPQALWALEQAADEIAYRHSIDSIALRKRWYPDDLLRHQLLDWAASLPVWVERDDQPSDGRFRRGVGLAMGTWAFLYHSHAQVIVGSDANGFFVRVGTQDIGTGTRSVLAGVVAEVFGIPRNRIKVEMGHSSLPLGPVSGGSQVTNSVYGPAVTAAEKLRQRLLELAGSELGLSGTLAATGGIQHANGFLPWQELLSKVPPLSFQDTRGSEPALNFLAGLIPNDERSGSLGRGMSKSVTVTQVEVDSRLGKIKPLGVWMAVAAGRIFAPVLARSQVEGGIVQGLGYALYEARQIDPATGFVLSANLEDYHVPGIGDVPPITVQFVEEGFDEVRSKGVGIGELATVAVAASVGNAVRHATGWRPSKTPISPADVLEGVAQ